ncbi:MAG: hypothetical protein NTW62_02315 [Candidatus Nomurabacteria bacterium]|nr:hypothetical protein [Candidatus Nomurabacteria bacterium]
MKKLILTTIVIFLTNVTFAQTSPKSLSPVRPHGDHFRTITEFRYDFHDSISLKSWQIVLVKNAEIRGLSKELIEWTKNLSCAELLWILDSATIIKATSFKKEDIMMAGIDKQDNRKPYFGGPINRDSKPGEGALCEQMKVIYGDREDYPGQLDDAETASTYCENYYYKVAKPSNTSLNNLMMPAPIATAPVAMMQQSPITQQPQVIHDTLYVDNNQNNNVEQNRTGSKIRYGRGYYLQAGHYADGYSYHYDNDNYYYSSRPETYCYEGRQYRSCGQVGYHYGAGYQYRSGSQNPGGHIYSAGHRGNDGHSMNAGNHYQGGYSHSSGYGYNSGGHNPGGYVSNSGNHNTGGNNNAGGHYGRH